MTLHATTFFKQLVKQFFRPLSFLETMTKTLCEKKPTNRRSAIRVLAFLILVLVFSRLKFLR